MSSSTSFGQSIRFGRDGEVQMTFLLPDGWLPNHSVEIDGLRALAVVLRFAERGWDQLEQFRLELALYRRQRELGRPLPEHPMCGYELSDTGSRVVWLAPPAWVNRCDHETRSDRGTLWFEGFGPDGFPSEITVQRSRQGEARFWLRRQAPRRYEVWTS